MSSKQPWNWWQNMGQELDLGVLLVARFVRQVRCWRTGSIVYRNDNRMPRSHGRQIRRRRRRMIIVEETIEENAGGQ